MPLRQIKNKSLEALKNISKILDSNKPTQETLKFILDNLKTVFEFDKATILFIEGRYTL